jgi:ribosomal protein S14
MMQSNVFKPNVISPAFKKKRLFNKNKEWSSTIDQKRRFDFFLIELPKLVEKSVTCYIKVVSQNNSISNKHLTKASSSASVTKIRNRCILTTKSHTINRLGLSRIAFRRLANLGGIPGLCKV